MYLFIYCFIYNTIYYIEGKTKMQKFTFCARKVIRENPEKAKSSCSSIY